MSSSSFSNMDKEDQIIHLKKHFVDEKSIVEKNNKASAIAVWKALAANLGIATIKLVCWFFSQSSALLAEAIHSFADGFNSVCLLIGIKRGSRPADKFHPFGYGLEANIWALFASILMLIGTAVSLYNGTNKLFFHDAHETSVLLANYNLIAVALIASILFEVWAVLSAANAVIEEAEVKVNNKLEAYFKSFKYIKNIKSPTTKFVWYEDSAALIGVLIAFSAITLSRFINESYAHIPDAVASIMIGFLLFALAIYLLKNNIQVLTGVAARPQVEALIREIASKVKGVSTVFDLKTMDMGSSGLIVNMEIEVDPETQVKDADDIAEKLEGKIREKIKNIAHVTIEVQASDIEDDWNEKFGVLIKEGLKHQLIKPGEAKILSKFSDFTNTVVDEVMVPRPDVVLVSSDSTIDELVDVIITSGHTRIPIYSGNIDNVIGIAHAKDALRLLNSSEDKEKVDLETLAREIPIVPENKPISDMLNEFNKNKGQMAAVVDEHGGFAGIVTVEDILEEIVGEIWDEYDVEVPEIIKINQNTISVYARMNIDSLNSRFGLDLPTEDFQSIGGYVFGILGREPQVKDEVIEMDIKMIVEEMDGHKITRVMLVKPDGFIDNELKKTYWDKGDQTNQ